MKFILILFILLVFGALFYLISTNQNFKTFLPPQVNPDRLIKETCKGTGERLEIGQTGDYWCRKILPDAGHPCSNSSDCISGYCMTNIPQASVGKCYESKTSDFCLWGVTIEEAQKKPKGSVIAPCVF